MKRDITNQAQYEAWLASAKAEAGKRFLRLEPADNSHSHWKLINTSNEVVFPLNGWGASKALINGYFMQNPQA